MQSIEFKKIFMEVFINRRGESPIVLVLRRIAKDLSIVRVNVLSVMLLCVLIAMFLKRVITTCANRTILKLSKSCPAVPDLVQSVMLGSTRLTDVTKCGVSIAIPHFLGPEELLNKEEFTILTTLIGCFRVDIKRIIM